MAHHQSAFKRIRTSEKARVYNRQYKTRMRKAIKAVLTAENKEAAQENLNKTVSLLDKMALKGIIHKNKASNQKSSLACLVNSMQ